MKAVYGSWKDGSDIYKDRKGFYIIQWNPHTENEYKKYLRGFKPTGPIAYIRSRTRKVRSKKRKTVKRK